MPPTIQKNGITIGKENKPGGAKEENKQPEFLTT
jgi:hypothetical protein